MKKLKRYEKSNLIHIKESIDLCRVGCFIDGEEYGYFATSTEYDTLDQVDPSELIEMDDSDNLPPNRTHILWITK